MDTAVAVRRISVWDYHRMAEAGIFHPTEHVELLDGQIIQMAAKGTAHSAAITRADRLLRYQLGDRVLIRLQDPVQLDDYSEPEPDIAVVKPNPLFYDDYHPTPSEIFLLIEIADTSLTYDREIKAPAYAKSGIQEYWVLDVNTRRLHVYRLPTATGYQSETIFAEELTISLLSFPDCAIAVQDLLRPTA